MKRNLAKILAIVLAICLLAPIAALAAEEETEAKDTYKVTVTLSGDGKSITKSTDYLAADSRLYEALTPLVDDAEVAAAFGGKGLGDTYYLLKRAAGVGGTTWQAELDSLGVTFSPAEAKSAETIGDLAAFSGAVVASYNGYTVDFLVEKKTVESVEDFVDVDEDDYYFDAVSWAVENGVTNGTNPDAAEGEQTFEPDKTVTRAEAVTFLWRAYGSPTVNAVNHFEDVSTSDWFYAAVLWAEQQGVTKGVDETHFAPNEPCTRAQQVTFQYRAADAAANAADNEFTDVDADAYYAEAVTWAADEEITNGVGNNQFDPDSPISRAQAVTMLYRDLADEA